MVLATQIRDQSRANTIQVLPDAKKEQYDTLLFDLQARGPILPARATQARERFLRYNVYYHDYLPAIRGTSAGIMKRIGATPWEIKGPEQLPAAKERALKQAAALMGFNLLGEQRTDIEYYQQIVRQADFGRGWNAFIEKGVDFLRQDRGWFWELIFPGNALSEPEGPLMGIAHLDSLKCRPTGDPNYPVIYFDKQGDKHLLHASRVRQIVDMLDGDERKPGYGDCALSRAVSIAWREALINQYVEANLDDKPPPGIVVWQGITKQERERAAGEYRKEQSNDERPVWGRNMHFHGMDKDTPVEVTTTPFSQAPEKFDFKTYVEVNVNYLALAYGIDVQEIWQLTGGNIGSEGQSEILHQKSRGKLIGAIYTAIERSLNDALPEEYEFTFKRRDAEQNREEAEIANTWATVVQTAGSNIQPEEARQLLASQSEPVKDAITDENGQIRRVQDLDVQPQEQIVDDANAGALATLGAQTNTAAPALSALAKAGNGRGNDGDVRTRAGRAADVGRGEPDPAARAKDLQATRLDFESDFSDAVLAAKSDALTRTRFGIVARALISKYGRKAYQDGLADGGIEDDLSEDDLSAIAALIAEQSSYVTDFADALFADTDPDPESKAEMWFNKSVMPFYQDGLISADKNGLYEWAYGDTEHCEDCLRLNGQKHRLSGWLASGFMPQGENLACHGFRCACALVKTTGRASGSY